MDRPLWTAEIKWDGYWGLIYGADGVIQFRQGRDLTKRFPELHDVVQRFATRSAIVDGEIVAFVDGQPDFGALQGRTTPAIYVAFDVLALDGQDTTTLPLSLRREMLAALIGSDDHHLIRSRPFDSAVALFAEAEARGLEGIVCKSDGPYVPGPQRTRSWLKTKTSHGMSAEKHRQLTWGHK